MELMASLQKGEKTQMEQAFRNMVFQTGAVPVNFVSVSPFKSVCFFFFFFFYKLPFSFSTMCTSFVEMLPEISSHQAPRIVRKVCSLNC
jgi:hypothetical protein